MFFFKEINILLSKDALNWSKVTVKTYLFQMNSVFHKNIKLHNCFIYRCFFI